MDNTAKNKKRRTKAKPIIVTCTYDENGKDFNELMQQYIKNILLLKNGQ